MKNLKICDCPYTDWCHTPRQMVQRIIMKDTKKTIQDCCFYQEIEKQIDEQKHSIIKVIKH